MTNLDFVGTVDTGRVVLVIGDPGLVLAVKENLKDKENHVYK